ncbi:hypothetical protein HBI56_016780 [Parastagonospora nodorum]|nr:hypothetical protein HBI01_076550 [Parastagonospora nodorum]KAH4318126.1 hypothetical protein HBI02_024240 [Parastagonospora nodorum]KAH4330171.1 hypothetical protein HBI00_086690 [Parastagonospora nodorum]KAH4392801.1 hypothetical protein HBH94_003310 [Parastagonospora nodorum]KAH4477463.1 hypothetical protein HBH90_009350 [Parastagonospora nodorum]
MSSSSIAQTASSHIHTLAKFPRSKTRTFSTWIICRQVTRQVTKSSSQSNLEYYKTLVANYGMQTSSAPLKSQYLSLCSYSSTKRPSNFPDDCSLSGTSI